MGVGQKGKSNLYNVFNQRGVVKGNGQASFPSSRAFRLGRRGKKNRKDLISRED